MKAHHVRCLSVALVLLAACRNGDPVNVGVNDRNVTVTKSGTGTGTVTSAPGGIVCGPQCSAVLSSQLNITLTAAPSATSNFAGWSGSCTGTELVCVLPGAAAAITTNAQFTLKP
ncbi:MAG: hypothetical protein V4617_03700 [Gemmatimonadota bacterium]